MEADAMRRAAFISGWHARGDKPLQDLQGALQHYTDTVLAQAPASPGEPAQARVMFTLPCGADPKAEMPYLALRTPWTGPLPRVGERVRLPTGLFGMVTMVDHERDVRTVRLAWLPLSDGDRATFHAMGWSGWPQ